MYERISATKWRLTDDARRQIGALLLYMRQEWCGATTAWMHVTDESDREAIEGAAVTYRTMVQCVDRILSRLDGRVDGHRIASCLQMMDTVLALTDGGHISRRNINSAEAIHGTIRPDSSRHRGDDARPSDVRGAHDGGIDYT